MKRCSNNLPPISHEVVWVTATTDELALLNIMAFRESKRTKIMMCNHYQICESVTKVVGDSFMTFEDVRNKLETSKLVDLKVAQAELESYTSLLESCQASKPGPEANEAELANYLALYKEACTNLKKAKEKFDSAQGGYNFFVNVFKALEEPDNNECLICRDQIQLESLAMLHCSHFFCYDCLLASMVNHRKCPFCRQQITDTSSVMRIKPVTKPETEDEATKKLKLKGLDTSKYGSKLIALYNYVTDLIESDPEARIILFLQYRALSDHISKTLTEIGIDHVRVSGTVFKRQGAIDRFVNSKSVRLIMLSSEDSVSGINLTQATHVILLHPFWTDQGEAVDLAWEKQGICRAYRTGLDHPLKVVRFAVKDTIEEELTNRRLGKL